MKRLSITQLRALFLLFWLALAIPSAMLSWKAHEQLRWQALRQYQKLAQRFIVQIDTTLTNAIAKEEARATTDYNFLVLAGDPKSRFVQRSELSKYPVESNIKSIIGYFQVDEKGRFSSPVLPASASEATQYGITQTELAQRKQLATAIQDVLSQNQLVSRNGPRITFDDPSTSLAAQYDTEYEQAQDVIALSGQEENQSRYAVQQSKPALTAKDNAKSKPRRSASPATEQAFSASANARFSELQSIEQQQKITENIGRPLEDKQQQLVLEKRYKKSQLRSKQKPVSSKQRLEKEYSPQPIQTPALQHSTALDNTMQLSLFKSQLAPFQFSLLESGHFVVYRQVWRNQKRLIQGALIDAEPFLQQMIRDPFMQSALQPISNLSIAYGDKIITTFVGQPNADRFAINSQPTLQGEVLAVLSLSTPFSSLAAIFHITQMPTGAGANVVILLAGSLMLILILGTYLLYRLTLRQSLLAQQQQDFVSSVSHELKTPLTSIQMYGEILQQGWASEDKKQEYYQYIFNETERLSRLISNVLQISKVSRNQLELQLQPIKLAELVSLIHSKIDSQINQSAFTLMLNIEPELAQQSLNVDTDAFIQIIINLVDNAIKYANKAQTKQIDIQFRHKGNNAVEIIVRDYGPGIAKNQIKHIFKRFYRSGNELTREATGTGIGLALVKELSDAMQAKIDVKNHKPGAAFILTFHLHSSSNDTQD